MCGLMLDPRPLVDHVYSTMITFLLKESRPLEYKPGINSTLLESIYKEAAIQLPGSALHNQHINYYDHVMDDDTKRPRDSTPIYTPSKVYIFNEMMENVTVDRMIQGIPVMECKSQSNNYTQECGIWIQNPGVSFTMRFVVTLSHNF